MIVKVQCPLNIAIDPTGNVPCLIYPESRKATVQQPVTPDVMQVLLVRNGKAYYHARWNADAQVYVLGELARDQDW